MKDDAMVDGQSDGSRRDFTLRVPEAHMPAVLIGLRRYLEAERAENEQGRSLGKRGLADELESVRADLVAQRDEQLARLGAAEQAADGDEPRFGR